MFCLWDDIKDLAKPRKVFTKPSGYYNEKGRWVERPETEGSVLAVVQPTKTSDLDSLPENRRSLKSISVWTEKALVGIDTNTGQQPDIIEYQGERFELVKVRDWTEDGGYFKSIAQRVEQ